MPKQLLETAGRMSRAGRDWRLDVIVLIALGAVITILFAVTDLDVAVARVFYSADAQNHWPLGRQMPWSVLYRMAPWITASLVLAGFSALAVGHARGRDGWRRQATFVLLSVVLGPGLIINGIFKDHWDRPRPRDIVEFAGQLHYAPAPLRGEGGASFPCGHCSVGFLYAVGWWIWRRRRPSWAGASLAAGLIAGTALGLGRMAAGGHFLSDVFWSAFLALGLAHALYYYALRIPAHEAQQNDAAVTRTPISRARYALPILAALGGMAVLVALFATPHGTQLATEIPFASLGRVPKIFELTARAANVEITIVDSPAAQVSVAGELHGFGLPTSQLLARSEFEAEPTPTLRYLIEQRGWFTDLDAAVSIRLPIGQLERIVVRLSRGNVKVTDATRAHVVNSGGVQLDLRTQLGHVWTSDR
jgi:membrane-associated PAP2 superfamily phosphatase